MTSVQIWEGNVKRTWQYIHVHKHSATVSSSSSATSKGSSASSSVTSSSTNQPTYLDLSEIQTETNDNTNNLTTLRPVSEGHYVSKHNIILYHDTITGTRSLAVDFEEVPESLGISSTFLGVNQVIRDTTNMPTTHSGGKGEHILPFTVNVGAYRRRNSRDKEKTGGSNTNIVTGYVKVKKKNFFSFEYSCYVENNKLKEITQQSKSTALSNSNESQDLRSSHIDTSATEGFTVEINDYTTVYDKKGKLVVFYPITVTRKLDGATTLVHRRFQEFDQLYHHVDASFKGNHLRSSLPKLPDKKLKLLVEHVNDRAFLQERQENLDKFIKNLLNVPHVSSMDNVQIFLGFYNSIREFSLVFQTPVNDITVGTYSNLFPSDSNDNIKQNDHDSMIVVTGVKNSKLKEESDLKVGDNISKLCGEVLPDTTEGLRKLQEALASLGRGDRDGRILLHFLQQV